MNLILDTGNTFTKLYLFDKDRIVASQRVEQLDLYLLDKIFKEYPVEASIYSHVGNANNDVSNFLKSHSDYIAFNHQTSVPIKNNYQTPETLGLDRLAAVCAAAKIFPNTNVLCIDMGTCVTYDFISADGTYMGGAISPGLTMRYKAMHTFTAQLPLLQANTLQKQKLIGANTDESMRSGAFNGFVFEILGFIEAYQRNYENLQCLICGGDAALLDTQLKNSIFVRADLVAEGLNTILNYNVQKQN
jgi:type III pantothenate kinase